MTSGKVVDIRTGRAIARTSSLSETFASYIQSLIERDEEFYIVHGPCRHKDVRSLVDGLRQTVGLLVIPDRQMPPDTLWAFDGDPAELGFAV